MSEAAPSQDYVNKQQAMRLLAQKKLAWGDETEEAWNSLLERKGVARHSGNGAESSVLVVKFADVAETFSMLESLLLPTANQENISSQLWEPTSAVKSKMKVPADSTSGNSDHPTVPLVVRNGTHKVSRGTTSLLEQVGGVDKILAVTTLFYEKMFRDRHLQQFVENQDDPHPERLANWIAEKMSGTPYWSSELPSRTEPPHDRSSAHYKAWNSNKRSEHRRGDHFKLDDAIMWMRLMFWSCRDAGFEENSTFMKWYVQFIAHFMRVYERRAPPFAEEAMLWSRAPENIARYETDGFLMKDVIGMR